jgi:uncharacterized repeat protein (TIGR01451 family)
VDYLGPTRVQATYRDSIVAGQRTASSCPLTVSVPLHAFITAVKSVDRNPAVVGGPMTYTVTVSNAGTDTVTGITVWDILPAGVTFGSASAGGSFDGSKAAWTLGSLPPGASASCYFSVNVNAGFAFIGPNIALVDYSDSAKTPQSRVATNGVTVSVISALVEIAKTGPASAVTPGNVEYTLALFNSGVDTAFDVEVIDTLPTPLRFASATGGGVASGNVVKWRLADIGPGRSVIVRVVAGAPVQRGDLDVTNRAHVTYVNSAGASGPAGSAFMVVRLMDTKLRVYPNPFNPEKSVRGKIKFQGLPLGSKVRVYTPRGLLVWEGNVVTPYVVEWDGRKRVAPGAYLWVVESDQGKTKGTLIVE